MGSHPLYLLLSFFSPALPAAASSPKQRHVSVELSAVIAASVVCSDLEQLYVLGDHRHTRAQVVLALDSLLTFALDNAHSHVSGLRLT